MRCTVLPGLRLRSGLLASMAALLAASQTACQRYERRPLDLDAHRGEFVSRLLQTPSAPVDGPTDATPPPGPFDASDGLSLDEAEIVALIYNADLRVARLEAGVAKATAEHTGRWDDPTIGVDVTRILQGGPNPWKVLTNIGLTLPISGRLRIEKERAGLEHAVAVARAAHLEWRTRIALRQAWASWSSLETVAQGERRFIEQLEGVLLAIDAMERGNEITRAEARLFRIERVQAAASLAATEAERRQIELEILHLMGLAPTAAVSLHAQWPEIPDLESPPEQLADRSPALLIARAEYDVAEKSLELEIRKQYPDLFVAPGYGREDGDDEALLDVLAPIPILNANKRGIAEARAERELARARAQGRLEQVMSLLAAAGERARASSERRRLLERESLPLADAQVDDARRMAELGELDAMVLLESLRRRTDAHRRAAEARLAESRAALDYLELAGDTPAVDTRPEPASRRTP